MKTKKDDILLLKPRRRNKFKEILVWKPKKMTLLL
jgi:hypothetical protein